MKNKNSNVARRAWRILRLALLWARKGGVFKNRISISLSLLQKGIKTLRHSHYERGALISGERELSFDATPIIHVKMHRPGSMRFKMPHIPCINPHVDFDYDLEFNEDEASYYDRARKSFLKGADDQEEEGCDDHHGECEESCNDIGIDLKAEEFIAKFYEQMRMQREMSYLQYNAC